MQITGNGNMDLKANDLNTTGSITASAFYGSGAALTGIAYVPLAGTATTSAYATLTGSASSAAAVRARKRGSIRSSASRQQT